MPLGPQYTPHGRVGEDDAGSGEIDPLYKRRSGSVAGGSTSGVQARLADFTELVAATIANAHAQPREELRTLADEQVMHVDVDATDSAVRLAVRDDGVGGADPAQGSGLLGLYDRLEGAGGTIAIHSPIGEGTELLVELPLRPVPAPE